MRPDQRNRVINTLKVLPVLTVLILPWPYAAIGQENSEKSEPGKCYIKTLESDTYRDREIALPIYTGNDVNILQKYVTDTTITIHEETYRWVKIQDRKNGSTQNKVYSEGWVTEEVPAETLIIEGYLRDTTISKDYIFERTMVRELVQYGGFTEWKEVVCESALTIHLINQVRKKLGLARTDDNVMDAEMRHNLIAYQKMYALTTGRLTIETLHHMGIEWD